MKKLFDLYYFFLFLIFYSKRNIYIYGEIIIFFIGGNDNKCILLMKFSIYKC